METVRQKGGDSVFLCRKMKNSRALHGSNFCQYFSEKNFPVIFVKNEPAGGSFQTLFHRFDIYFEFYVRRVEKGILPLRVFFEGRAVERTL